MLTWGVCVCVCGDGVDMPLLLGFLKETIFIFFLKKLVSPLTSV